MSKQSRAKSRRHKKATGAKAPVMTFEERVAIMDEATKYYIKSHLKDELHDILCARQKYWGYEPISLFYCECWWQLAELVKDKRNSKSKTRVLEILRDLKVLNKYR